MEKEQATKIVETLLYMTDHALTEGEIAEILENRSFKAEKVREIIKEISDKYDASDSGLRVIEVAGGFQMATRPEMAEWIRKLYKERLTVRLSPSSLETLAIIAYKQPITRGEIEQIRGVEASGVMETLLERRLLKVVGRKETIGRPLLYGTTIEFLRHFGLKHLSELPDIASIPATLEAQAQTDDAVPAGTEEEPQMELAEVGAPSEAAAEIPAETGSSDEVSPEAS